MWAVCRILLLKNRQYQGDKIMNRRRFLTTGLVAGAAAIPTGLSPAAELTRGKLRIIGVSCSPRKGKTTYRALEICLKAAEEVSKEIDTALIELADLDIRPCNACMECKKELRCSIQDDFAGLIPVLADKKVAGMIIGTPVYFGMMTAQCKAFLDRCGMFRFNDWIFRNRVGGALAVGSMRNGGQEITLQAVRTVLLCHDMICVSEGKDTAHFGATLVSGGEGGIEADSFGLKTARNLGRRVAELAVLVNLAKNKRDKG
jgi:multimeric flavodoxin WrbA